MVAEKQPKTARNPSGPAPEPVHPSALSSHYEARLRRAAVEISMASERERRAIACEVHDNIAQELAIAKLRLGQVCAEAQGDQIIALDEIRSHIADALEACRKLTYELATPTLYKLGLIPAVRNLVSDFRKSHQLNISARLAHDEIALPPDSQVILYRVIRELFVNIVKHAKAGQIDFSLSHTATHLHIDISDDGTGFDVPDRLSALSPDAGLGLFLVRERLTHLGATLELESAAGKGTRARLRVPLDRPEITAN